MKTILSCFILLLCITNSDAQTISWAKDIGDSSDVTATSAICMDNNYNVYQAGWYRTRLSACGSSLPQVIPPTGPGANINEIIVKYDSFGNCVWALPGIAISRYPTSSSGISAIKYAGQGALYATGVYTDTLILGSDTLYNDLCTMGSCNIAYVMKLSTDGDVIWTKNINGRTNGVPRITYMEALNGSAYVYGVYNDTISIDGVVLGSYNSYTLRGFIAKINGNGTCVWIKDVATHGQMDSNGGFTTDGKSLYVRGDFGGALTFSSDSIYAPNFGSFIAKYDTNGNFKWVYGGSGKIDNALSFTYLHYDGAGHIYMDGSFHDTVRIDTVLLTSSISNGNCIARFDTTGNFNWAFSPHWEAGYLFGTAISPDNSGFYLLSSYQDTAYVGGTTYIPTGMADVVLIRYDTSRNVMWSRSYGGVRQEHAVDMVSRNGTVYYSFNTNSSFDMDGFPIINHNYMDIVLAKMYDPYGGSSTFAPNSIVQAGTTVYPNPTTGEVYIRGTEVIDNIAVYSLAGEQVLSKKNDRKEAILEMGQLPVGIYLLRCVSDSKSETFKVVKE